VNSRERRVAANFRADAIEEATHDWPDSPEWHLGHGQRLKIMLRDEAKLVARVVLKCAAGALVLLGISWIGAVATGVRQDEGAVASAARATKAASSVAKATPASAVLR
jgi:hypothetical protein